MRRYLITALLSLMLLLLLAGALSAAQGAWPSMPLNKHHWRGAGFYLSWIKILASWLLFLLWVKTTDWVNTDCQELKKLNYSFWNLLVFGAFISTYVLFWLIPLFWVGCVLLLLAYICPLVAYIVVRNSKVTSSDQQVLTREHIRYLSAFYLNKVGMNISYEKADPHESGPPIKVLAHGDDERVNNTRLIAARQSPGLLFAREILADGLAFRASAIMLDYTQQAVGMNIMVDGVWIPRENMLRKEADPALNSLKLLCGLNPQDRQSRQSGTFAAEHKSVRYVADLTTQGTSTGERVLLQFEQKKTPFKTPDQLGMRPKLQAQIQELLAASKGFLLFSAPPGNGLRSSTNVLLHCTDRFTREFAAVEEVNIRYEPVENVPALTYNPAEGQTLEETLVKIFRTEPNVVVVRDLGDAQVVSMICQEANENRLIVGTVRAKDCADALMRVLALGVPPLELARSISGVLCQRLVRKLCESCKEAYAPTPEIIQQLGIPQGRISAFYRPPQLDPQRPKEICKTCNGIGYYGRTAVFELLTVGDNVRRTLANSPKIDLLRQAARKDGMVSLQEEGILLVAKGVTSLADLMRILKQ
ncbi:MAG: ATPase, T2SS/T4P/T4SS family [Thermoguttaceae bacterium]